MKKNILLSVMLMLSAVTFAQQQLATLNHNNDITVYYGADALISAHNAAETGDIITLSSGVFNATNITKAVTIRGAGAWADASGGNTIIRNDFNIGVVGDSIHHFILEGVYALNHVYCNTTYYPQFIKCYFQWIGVPYGGMHSASYLNNASFINCILGAWVTRDTYSEVNGTQFVNSVILYCNEDNRPESYINCVLKQNPGNASSRLFQNCVLYWDYADTVAPANNSTTSFNCLYVQMNSDSSNVDELYSPVVGHTLWGIRGMSNVFQTFNGSTEGVDFRLLDNVATTYLGTDGTQVGIYGGTMPFDPHVTSPLIRRITVAPRSNANGQLPVDIEVTNE